MKWSLLSRQSTNIEVVGGPPPRHLERVPDARRGTVLVDIERIRYAARMLDEVREQILAARRATLGATLAADAFGSLPTATAFTGAHAERQEAGDTESLAMVHAVDRLQDYLRDAVRRFQAHDAQAAADTRQRVEEFRRNLRHY